MSSSSEGTVGSRDAAEEGEVSLVYGIFPGTATVSKLTFTKWSPLPSCPFRAFLPLSVRSFHPIEGRKDALANDPSNFIACPIVSMRSALVEGISNQPWTRWSFSESEGLRYKFCPALSLSSGGKVDQSTNLPSRAVLWKLNCVSCGHDAARFEAREGVNPCVARVPIVREETERCKVGFTTLSPLRFRALPSERGPAPAWRRRTRTWPSPLPLRPSPAFPGGTARGGL